MIATLRYAALAAGLAGCGVFAQPLEAPTAATEAPAAAGTAPPGSPGFCLFELPASGDRQLWLNLGIVQYLELRPDELRVYYGGGNLGSGHEARFALKQKADGAAIVQRMRDTAAACR